MSPWTRHRSRSASGSSASSRRCASAISSADEEPASRPAERPREQPLIAAAYDRWAATYDTDRNITRDLDASVLRAVELPLARATVLELGCGTGKNTAWLAEHAHYVIALDLSAGMLERARERVCAANVAFVEADIRDPWPVRDDAVDVVVANLVLEHVEILSAVFAETVRVLRPGGDAFFCELHPYRQWRGGQAHFTDAASGAIIHIDAHLHSTSDYVNAAVESRLTLRRLGEWLEPDAPTDSPPRLLSLRLRR